MKRFYKVLFVAVLGLILIAAAVDVKNSGMRADNGRLLNPVGTAALPGVILNGDPNTGLYQIAGDNIGWSAGGDLRFDVAPLGATITRNDCQTTYFPSLDLMNNTAATVGQTQFSPSAWFDAKAWNTAGAGSSEVSTFAMTNEPINGNPPLSELTIGHRRAGAALTQMAKFNSTGDLNLTDDLTCNQATMTVPGIGATSTTHNDARNGLMLVNSTSCATGTTTQVSPGIQFTGHALDSDASDPDKDDTWDWKILNAPTSANTTSSALNFQVAKKAGTAAWGNYFSTFVLNDSGRLSILSPGTVAQTSYYNSTTGYVAGSDGFDFQVDGNDAYLWLREASNMKFGTAGTERLQLNSTAATFAVPVTVTGAVSASTTTTTGTAASFGGGTPTAVVTKLTTDATVFHVWTAAVLAAESCVNVRASCSVIDKAATASHNSYDKETLCCNAAGTTACDAVTAVRELEVEAAWDMTILPCDAVAGSCLTADAPVVAITGEAAHNLNWKCSVNSYVLTNG